MLLTGPIYCWSFRRKIRRYAVVTLPFAVIRDIIEVRPFSGVSGSGEQRTQTPAHVRQLARAVEEGEFTPTNWAATVPASLLNKLTLNSEEERFSLELSPGEKLSLADGGHRCGALTALQQKVREKMEKESGRPHPDAEIIASCEVDLEDIDALPVTLLIYLDGSSQRDFINLQRGRPVDKSTIFVMESLGNEDGDIGKTVVQMAKALHNERDSPFYAHIKLDSCSQCSLPISTLAAKGSSDLSTSLVGLANVGWACDIPMTKLVACITRMHRLLNKKYPELLEPGRVLTPLRNSGTKAASTMWVGLGILLAYSAGREPLDAHADELAETCYEVLRDSMVHGSFSSGMKRQLMGELARRYFEGREDDFEGGLCDGVPVGLIAATGAAAFNVSGSPRKKIQKRQD